MSRYAEGTTVSVEKSRAEIEAVLRRYGADQFISGWSEGKAVIGFRAKGRHVRFVLALPIQNEKRFTHPKVRGWATPVSAERAAALWEQACRTSWRALLLVIKAKLEAVAAGISTFETEFMAHVLLPDGQTVGQWMAPQIAAAYETGAMPQFLPGLPAPKGD